MLQLVTKEDKADEKIDMNADRPGLDLICVLDKSGSMGG